MEKSYRKIPVLISLLSLVTIPVHATELSLPSAPLFVANQNLTSLVMLVMGRDHTLYYEAYNDASDLDGDEVLDTHYDPKIEYYGLFDSHKCYTYASDLFSPTRTTADKKCSNEWSGDFLNYLTTSRIDALRKVLYGGLRYNDSTNTAGVAPILTRSYIPKDAHSWGKTWDPAVMNTTAAGNLNISSYAPLKNDKVYFFASTSLTGDKDKPLLRVLETIKNPSPALYIWNWVSRESTDNGGGDVGGIAGQYMTGYIDRKGNEKDISSSLSDYTVRVQVCVTGLLEDNCTKYPNGNYKPTGLLHDYGAGNEPKMEFGLLSGSYKNNTQGGVLRAKVGKLKDEIVESTGQIKTRTGGVGIFDTLNKLKVVEFNGKSYQPCDWRKYGPITNGICTDWGNPIGEMLYEAMRYFGGAKVATSAFDVADDSNGLMHDSWDDPFEAEGRHWCDKPVNLIISDINPSYDSDQIPGSAFKDVATDPILSGLNVAEFTKSISTSEGLDDKTFFIGDNKSTIGNNTPTAKKIADLGHIRGLSPQEPTKMGSFYSAGVAYYGHINDVNIHVPGGQKPRTMAVALASPLPEIKIKFPALGKSVTLIPYAKSVGGGGDTKNGIPNISSAEDGFQPTNTIVDYYVESKSDTKGKFRINFEDVEQGADHDMDMIVFYEYELVGDNQVKVTLTSSYAGGGIDQHAGYVISGTTKDGLYLDVKDIGGGQDLYYLDTVGDLPRKDGKETNDLPLTRTRIFTVKKDADATAAEILKSPLWYAAKWGSFKNENINKEENREDNGDDKPDDKEWNSLDKNKPDNYFLVTNATSLKAQLSAALDNASKDDSSATSMSYTSSQITNDSFSFDSSFEARQWSGEVSAFAISGGTVDTDATWKASERLTAQGANNRVIVTMDSDGSKRVFSEPVSLEGSSSGLSSTQISALVSNITSTDVALKLSYVKTLVNYLRGERTYEEKNKLVPLLGTPFRQRKNMLGDVVHSTPVYGVSAGDSQPFVIFGANDGMVHVLNATTGDELFAYIPSSSYKNLYRLAQTTYDQNHRFFVDGTIKVVTVKDGDNNRTIAVGTFGFGAQGAWALDLTTLKGLTASSATNRLLWELTDSDSSKIGYMMNAPTIIPVTSGDDTSWVAIFGNGYNNSEADAHADTTGEGGLLVADLLTGQLKNTLLTNKGKTNDPTGASRPNGLTEPVAADSDLDGQADALYAGDLFGNVWKADIKGKAITNWAFETGTGGSPQPMFTATSRDTPAASQPITVRPSVAYHPDGGLLVMVGTGKYIETTDVSVENQTTQSIYGLWDKPGRTTTITRSSLLEQTLDDEISDGSYKHRETSKNLIDWDVNNGWRLDLYYQNKNNGERLNSKIVVRNTVAAFTTLIPSIDPCTGGGTGWYMEVDIYTGSNTSLVEQSALLDGIPSEPVTTIEPDPKGDKKIINKVKINGKKPFESPGVTLKTGSVSWQMLY
jgi:type IV pilus assembly protein PilY1